MWVSARAKLFHKQICQYLTKLIQTTVNGFFNSLLFKMQLSTDQSPAWRIFLAQACKSLTIINCKENWSF